MRNTSNQFMKKIFFLFLTAGLILKSQAQTTFNDLNAEKRTVGSFHGVEVSTGIALYLGEGQSEDVAVSASTPEFRNKIITKVEDGILKIYYENKNAFNTKRVNKELKAYVSYKTLDKLEATTGADIHFTGALNVPVISMTASTGGNIQGEIKSDRLSIHQSTGSNIQLNGSVQTMDAEGSTGSHFRGQELKAASCKANVSTGAHIELNAEKELTVTASTGGVIRYKGEAGAKSISKSTGGKIVKI
jgi:hypothetical protein